MAKEKVGIQRERGSMERLDYKPKQYGGHKEPQREGERERKELEGNS